MFQKKDRGSVRNVGKVHHQKRKFSGRQDSFFKFLYQSQMNESIHVTRYGCSLNYVFEWISMKYFRTKICV